ncbi:hypothetical protein HK104_009941 [Borealophlyctis nickersoniae]|nr:hypothetical protein HK104_009941 [Borealophlyctis nickersoniae]
MSVFATHYHTGFTLLVLLCSLATVVSRRLTSPSKPCCKKPVVGADDSNDSSTTVTEVDGKVTEAEAVEMLEDAEKGESAVAADEGVVGEKATKHQVIEFAMFKRNYLIVYSLVMMSDWLQGSYIYPLYKSYGYDLADIGVLFIVGFLSSAVFGTVVGSLADRIGRKLSTLIFCFAYTLSCLTKLSPDYNVLLLGRLLGGISTSLLFSVFEAWMVSEHLRRNWKREWMSDTFAWAVFVNGLVAIGAGVLANFCAETWGYVSPFMVAIVFLAAAAALIHSTWVENYGNANVRGPPSFLSEVSKILNRCRLAIIEKASGTVSTVALMEAVNIIRNDAKVLATGAMQCCFESAMYTFVFLWSPVLEEAKAPDTPPLPYGVIFASFMVSIMLGSVIFKMLLSVGGWPVERIAVVAFGIGSASLLAPVVITVS